MKTTEVKQDFRYIDTLIKIESASYKNAILHSILDKPGKLNISSSKIEQIIKTLLDKQPCFEESSDAQIALNDITKLFSRLQGNQLTTVADLKTLKGNLEVKLLNTKNSELQEFCARRIKFLEDVITARAQRRLDNILSGTKTSELYETKYWNIKTFAGFALSLASIDHTKSKSIYYVPQRSKILYSSNNHENYMRTYEDRGIDYTNPQTILLYHHAEQNFLKYLKENKDYIKQKIAEFFAKHNKENYELYFISFSSKENCSVCKDSIEVFIGNLAKELKIQAKIELAYKFPYERDDKLLNTCKVLDNEAYLNFIKQEIGQYFGMKIDLEKENYIINRIKEFHINFFLSKKEDNYSPPNNIILFEDHEAFYQSVKNSLEVKGKLDKVISIADSDYKNKQPSQKIQLNHDIRTDIACPEHVTYVSGVSKTANPQKATPPDHRLIPTGSELKQTYNALTPGRYIKEGCSSTPELLGTIIEPYQRNPHDQNAATSPYGDKTKSYAGSPEREFKPCKLSFPPDTPPRWIEKAGDKNTNIVTKSSAPSI